MRIWPVPATANAASSRPETPRDLRPQIDEGYIVARSALHLSVKNGVIMRILRDGAVWDQGEAAALARGAIDRLALELSTTSARLSADSLDAAPTARESRGAHSKRDLARVRQRSDEADRLSALSRTLRGVAERLREAHDDDGFVRELTMRARDDTLNELMQARLMPRATPQVLTEAEQQEAIEGVKADLRRLLDERAGY